MRKDMGGAAAVVAATLGAADAAAAGTDHRARPAGREHGQRLGVPPRRRRSATTAARPARCTNTDAEGRLVLADALAYAVAAARARTCCVDLATLTGANAVALGKRTAALYSDNDELAAGAAGGGRGGRRAGVADAAARRLRRVPRQRRWPTCNSAPDAGRRLGAWPRSTCASSPATCATAGRTWTCPRRPGPTATDGRAGQGRHRLGRTHAAALAGRRWAEPGSTGARPSGLGQRFTAASSPCADRQQRGDPVLATRGPP